MTVETKSEKSKKKSIKFQESLNLLLFVIVNIIIYNLPHIVDISNNLAN